MTVFVSARSADERKKLVDDLRLDGESTLKEQGQFDAELVVNATSVADSWSWPTNLDAHTHGKALFDVAFRYRRTQIISEAERRGWTTIPGWRMLLRQAMGQFKLYTGQDAPAAVLGKVLEGALLD
jgi:shikimate 5-dehydrogenase